MSIQILGITGPSGAGKSHLCRILADRGIPVIDADQVYHSLLYPHSPCLNALREAFGEAIFEKDGSLNRAALSQIVFHDKEKLTLLNKTVLHFVLSDIQKQIGQLETKGCPAVAVDAPTLIESGFYTQCHRVVSVLAPPALRMERIRVRDRLTREQAEARIQAQPPEDFYRSHSHLIIENTTDENALQKEIEKLLTMLSI